MHNEDTGTVTVTAAKLIGGLIGLVTALLLLTTWIFAQIVEAKIERLGLVYPSRQEVVLRTEYEIRRAETLDDIKRTNERLDAVERRVTAAQAAR